MHVPDPSAKPAASCREGWGQSGCQACPPLHGAGARGPRPGLGAEAARAEVGIISGGRRTLAAWSATSPPGGCGVPGKTGPGCRAPASSGCLWGEPRSASIVSLPVSGAGRERACDLFLPRGFPASLGSPWEPGRRHGPWGPVWERPGLGHAGSLGVSREPTGLCSRVRARFALAFWFGLPGLGESARMVCSLWGISGWTLLLGPHTQVGACWPSPAILTCSLTLYGSQPAPSHSLGAQNRATRPVPTTTDQPPPSPQGCGRPTRVSGQKHRTPVSRMLGAVAGGPWTTGSQA